MGTTPGGPLPAAPRARPCSRPARPSPRAGPAPPPGGAQGAGPEPAVTAPTRRPRQPDALTQHVDVSDARARAAPPSLSECRPGRGGGEGGGGEGEATRESLWAAGRTGSRGGGSQGRAEGLGRPLEGRRGGRGPSAAGPAHPGARSLRRRAHPLQLASPDSNQVRLGVPRPRLRPPTRGSHPARLSFFPRLPLLWPPPPPPFTLLRFGVLLFYVLGVLFRSPSSWVYVIMLLFCRATPRPWRPKRRWNAFRSSLNTIK